MKNSAPARSHLLLPIVLPLLLCSPAGLRAGLLLLEDFEAPGEGARYTSTTAFSDGADDYFTRTDGFSEASGIPAYSGFGGSYFWAAEDVDAPENPTGLGLLEFAGLDISAISSFRISLDIGAGSATAFDSANDFVLVQYRVDAGLWETALAFQNNGQTFNGSLHQDADLDGIGEGTQLGLALQTFHSDLFAVTGALLDLRIDTFLTGGDEAVAFDNIQVSSPLTAVPEPATTALFMAAASALALLLRKRFLPRGENDSRA